jgi:regulator of protease activity HflC (stomatin/prohibitin superfamily)
MALDELMHNRASLNSAICMGMAGLEESWGIKVTRYEVQNIEVDKSTEESMAKQSAAERNRRVRTARALHALAASHSPPSPSAIRQWSSPAKANERPL